MTPSAFISKWRHIELKERSAAQEHFLDLCRLVDHPTPAEADATGETFCFEKGAAKHDGGDGYADVWKRVHFAIEYKGRHKDLQAAYSQLLQYREALVNPPLLVTCGLGRIIFCLFAENIRLLPDSLFFRLAEKSAHDSGRFSKQLGKKRVAPFS